MANFNEEDFKKMREQTKEGEKIFKQFFDVVF